MTAVLPAMTAVLPAMTVVLPAMTVVLPAMTVVLPAMTVEATGDPAGGNFFLNLINHHHSNASILSFDAMYFAHLSRSKASHRALSLLGPPKS